MTTLQVNVRKNYREEFELTLPLNATVGGVKESVYKNQKIECNNQHLTYLGRLLKDQEKITTLKPDGGTLHLRLVLKDQPRAKIANIRKPPSFPMEDEKVGQPHEWVLPHLQNLLNMGQNNIAQVIHLRGHVGNPQGEAAPPAAAADDALPAQQPAPPQPAARAAERPRQGNRFWDMFRFLNVFLLLRLFLFVHIFARGEPEFQSLLFIACFCYYLWRVGVVKWLWRKLCVNCRRNNRRNARNNNGGDAGNNNARRNEPVVLDRPLTRRELIERFLVGLFASLFPMWRPPVVRIREPQEQQGGAQNAGGAGAPNNAPRADNDVPDANNHPGNDENVEHEHQD